MTPAIPDRGVALVTGGSRGIGEAIARGLARAGSSVVVGGRDVAAGEAVARSIGATFQPLDVTDEGSLERACDRLSGGLDVLVNNAGATFDGFNADVARRTLAVNFWGTVHLTDRLLPLLRPHARIVMVSSGMGEVDCLGPALREEILSPSLERAALGRFAERFVEDVAAGAHAARGWPSNAYRVSKVVMNALVRVLARELEGDPRRIVVNAACPGWVRTAMGGPSAPRSPEKGAETPLWLSLLPPSDRRTGGFYRDKQAIDW